MGVEERPRRQPEGRLIAAVDGFSNTKTPFAIGAAPKGWEGPLPEEYPELTIRVLARPSNPVRLQMIEAYRNGLAKGVGQGWRDAFAVARERFPDVDDASLGRILLLALGLYDSNVYERLRAGEPPDPSDGVPVLVTPYIRGIAETSAHHFGISADELISRILSAWFRTACDMDGKLIKPVALEELNHTGG